MSNKILYLVVIIGLGLFLVGAASAAARGTTAKTVGPSHPNTILVRGGSFTGGGPGSGK